MHYEKLKEQDSTVNAETDFWFGDPCYVVPDSQWGSLCGNWSAYDKKHQDDADFKHHYVARVEHEPTGYVFYVWSTAYGDGTYRIQVNHQEVGRLPVDAGCLSAIPVGLIEHWKKSGEISDYEDLGHVVSEENLHGELVCEGGDFFWGRVNLPTGYEEEHDEEYEDCDEYSYV